MLTCLHCFKAPFITNIAATELHDKPRVLFRLPPHSPSRKRVFWSVGYQTETIGRVTLHPTLVGPYKKHRHHRKVHHATHSSWSSRNYITAISSFKITFDDWLSNNIYRSKSDKFSFTFENLTISYCFEQLAFKIPFDKHEHKKLRISLSQSLTSLMP